MLGLCLRDFMLQIKYARMFVHSLLKLIEFQSLFLFIFFLSISCLLRSDYTSLVKNMQQTFIHLGIRRMHYISLLVLFRLFLYLHSALSQHGVYSIPALFLYNKTKQTRFYGPRTLESIGLFYTKLTGNLVNAKLCYKSLFGEKQCYITSYRLKNIYSLHK